MMRKPELLVPLSGFFKEVYDRGLDEVRYSVFSVERKFSDYSLPISYIRFTAYDPKQDIIVYSQISLGTKFDTDEVHKNLENTLNWAKEQIAKLQSNIILKEGEWTREIL
ncbi:MAG: hypothetical protein QXG05_08050 [Nitrososphaerota archaeon]